MIVGSDGVERSDLEHFALEYVKRANQETLADLRQAARDFVASETPKGDFLSAADPENPKPTRAPRKKRA